MSQKTTNGHSSIRPIIKPTQPQSGLHVRVKFNNTLPDIPFDPKFIVNPLDVSRFVDYETTSLEQNSKHELLTPIDLGVDIDLILPERYAIPENPVHDAEDDKLINDDDLLLQGSKKGSRDRTHSQLHNKVVPWLKKTEYISTEFNRYGSSSEKTETKVGYNVRKNMREDEIFLDRESQIKAINKTFEAAQQPIEKHPTKQNVYAKRVMPLFPDFEMWKYFFAHVKFDSEPAPVTKADQMSQAIIRGAYDEELAENFVVYFMPTEVTMADRLIDQNNGLKFIDGKEYEYRSSREYNWSAKPDDKGDDFFFVFRDESVFYNKLSMEVTLKKRRNKSQNATVTTMIVKNREVNDEEMVGYEEKLEQLKKPRPIEQQPDLTAQALEPSMEEREQEEDEEREDEVKPRVRERTHSGQIESENSSSSGSDDDNEDNADKGGDDDEENSSASSSSSSSQAASSPAASSSSSGSSSL